MNKLNYFLIDWN